MRLFSNHIVLASNLKIFLVVRECCQYDTSFTKFFETWFIVQYMISFFEKFHEMFFKNAYSLMGWGKQSSKYTHQIMPLNYIVQKVYILNQSLREVLLKISHCVYNFGLLILMICFIHGYIKTLESPLDCKEIQPVHSEGDQPWDFFGRNDAKAETPVLWPPHVKS